ncbi:MAG: ABC transporter ATP-binding protein [Chromatiales bacterium]|jgi:peptide/nickel transport system ATP-binding protein|nr:MAG: ABC transporter ATP-binding protein [Chromatiales bacterium]
MSATPLAMLAPALLDVRGLSVTFATRDGPVHAVKDLSFHIAPGEVLGIVGESGSGKTQAAMAVLGLMADNGRVTGSIRFEGDELVGMRDSFIGAIRGARIAMVFQDPMTSLNPYLTIGAQMGLVLKRHRGLRGYAAKAECVQLLDAVHITDPASRLRMYPHELSGGMRQRVMIATALLCRPALLIADEPTTALDVTVQAQILALMAELRVSFGTAIILITHDLGVAAGTCDRLIVMKDGVCLEQGPIDDCFHQPKTAYARELLAAVPRLDAEPIRARPAIAEPVIRVDDLAMHYPVAQPGFFAKPKILRALDGVSLELRPGETLGVVGESGSGKSTLARAVLRLVRPTHGTVCLLGRELSELPENEVRESRRDMQLVFQDPLAALDPRMTVGEIIAEPLQVFESSFSDKEVTARVAEAMAQVGLDPEWRNRYPHQFSGGQCQRVGIARALILKPKLLVCDEAVSALDVTVQAQIVSLLLELQARLGLALIFISHDLAVVRRLSHRVMVMYLGKVMEMADAEELYRAPKHPYTRALMAAVPIPDPRLEKTRVKALVKGEVPSPLAPPGGCAFRTRCEYAVGQCGSEEPGLVEVGTARVACWRVGEI